MKNEQNRLANNQLNFKKEDIEFNADGLMLRGWLYTPNDQSNKVFPAIIMAHGFGALKEMDLVKFADAFAESGFVVIAFDYSNFGNSEGEIRNEANPWKQIEEYQHAITYASTLDCVDTNKIGIWGSSYSGGHALVVAARDSRVKCVVSQVPTISGSQNALRRVPPIKKRTQNKLFKQDRIERMKNNPPMMKMVVSNQAEDSPIYGSAEAVKWYSTSGKQSANWKNEVTLRSVEYASTYDPGDYISKISPTPLLMIVGKEDDVTPTDLALQAYENALEPKKLVLLSGGHFVPYNEAFNHTCEQTVKWFKLHLMADA